MKAEGVTVSLSDWGHRNVTFARGDITMSLSRVRRHRDVTFTRSETSRCHFHACGDIAMSLSHVRRHHDVTFTRVETSRCHFHACGDIAMSLLLGIHDVTFARDSQCHFHEGFTKLHEYIANFLLLFLVQIYGHMMSL